MSEEETRLTPEAYKRIRTHHPNRIPIFISRHPNANIAELPKKKFLVPHDATVGQFIWVVRNNLKLPPDKAMFVFVRNTLPPTSATLREIYAQYKSEDGALRMVYTSESVFGEFGKIEI